MASLGTDENTIQTRQSGEFTNISLEVDTSYKKKLKQPRRILHFSDGTLDEYSTDEEGEQAPVAGPVVDPKTLNWLPWFWYYLLFSAKSAFSAADTCGEKLAWFFGITSPKYQSAIDEYYRMKAEEEADQRQEIALNTISEVMVKADLPELTTITTTTTTTITDKPVDRY